MSVFLSQLEGISDKRCFDKSTAFSDGSAKKREYEDWCSHTSQLYRSTQCVLVSSDVVCWVGL